MLRTTALSLVLGAALVAPAAAQTILNANDVDEIVNLARGYGSATLSAGDGNPLIEGRIDGRAYNLIFLNCNDVGENCGDVRFFTNYTNTNATFETMNQWNYDRRFAKAYLTPEGSAVLEWDMDLEFGVTRATMDAAFQIWQVFSVAFDDYILGLEPAPEADNT
ncbi:MAG: YbjN domain-containing protein [Alphaproteobacteria bacterium]|nr:YbjN domain-containing protein [Alphaproteobacteria bacterium]